VFIPAAPSEELVPMVPQHHQQQIECPEPGFIPPVPDFFSYGHNWQYMHLLTNRLPGSSMPFAQPPGTGGIRKNPEEIFAIFCHLCYNHNNYLAKEYDL
jgi:hypothetical protein